MGCSSPTSQAKFATGRSSQRSGDGEYLKIAVNQKGIQPFPWYSNHHAEAQCPGQPTAPFTTRDAESLGAGQNPGIYPMSVEFPMQWNETVLCSPTEVNGHSGHSMDKCIDTMGMYERLTKWIKLVNLISSWMCPNTSQWYVNITVHIWPFHFWHCWGSWASCSLGESVQSLHQLLYIILVLPFLFPQFLHILTLFSFLSLFLHLSSTFLSDL